MAKKSSSATKKAAKKVAAKKVSPKKSAAKKSAPKKTAKKVSSKKAATKAAKKPSPPKVAAKKPTAKVSDKVKSDKAVVASVQPLNPLQKLEKKLRGWLDAKKKIVMDWDCGGDETLVNGKVDSTIWRWEDEDLQTLCGILIEELELPNAGEEFNKGGGSILLKNGQVVLSYEATYFGCGWDEEQEDIVETEPEERRGDLVLF